MARNYRRHRRSEEYDIDEDLPIGYQANCRNTQEVTEEERSGYDSNASYYGDNQESQDSKASEVSACVSEGESNDNEDDSQDRESQMSALRKMNVSELRLECSSRGIVAHGKKKAELIAALVSKEDSPCNRKDEANADFKKKLSTANHSVSTLKAANATQEMENAGLRKQLKGAIANKTQKEAECMALQTEVESLRITLNRYARNLRLEGGCIDSYNNIFEENDKLTEKLKTDQSELKRLQGVEREYRALTKKVIEAQTIEKSRESAHELEKMKQTSRAIENAEKAKQVAVNEELKSTLRIKEKEIAAKRKQACGSRMHAGR